MIEYDYQPPGVSDKEQAAYMRFKNSLVTAWGQGVRGVPISGDAALVAGISSATYKMIHEKYSRGLARLPFRGVSQQLSAG